MYYIGTSYRHHIRPLICYKLYIQGDPQFILLFILYYNLFKFVIKDFDFCSYF